MAGGIEEHAKGRARLVFSLRSTEFEHGLFPGIEVVDHDVHVHLLGNILARPHRRPELLDALEADALVTGGVAYLTPSVVRARLPIEQGAVELGEASGVVAVEDERGEACNSHDRHRTTDCGQKMSAIGAASDAERTEASAVP